jgi:hypothetical protein
VNAGAGQAEFRATSQQQLLIRESRPLAADKDSPGQRKIPPGAATVVYAHVWMMPKSYLIRVTSARKKCWSRAIFPAGAVQVLQTLTRISSSGCQSPRKSVVSQFGIQLRQNLNQTNPPFLLLLRNDLHHRTESFAADEPARSCHGFAPQRRKDSRGRRQWSTRMSG